MIRLVAIAGICAFVSGCGADYTVVFPVDGPPPVVIDAPRDVAIDNLWFVPGGERLICSGLGLTSISVIDVPTGNVAARFHRAWPIGKSGGLLVIWRPPGTVRVYDVAAGAVNRLWTHQEPYLGPNLVTLLPGGRFIKIRGSVRNLRTGAVVMECEPRAVLTDDLTRYVMLSSRVDKDGNAFLAIVLKDAADRKVKWTRTIQTPGLAGATAEFDAAGRTVLVRAQWSRPPRPGYRGPAIASAIQWEVGCWAIDATNGKPILPRFRWARFTADRKALLAQNQGAPRASLLAIPSGKELVRFLGLYGVVSSPSGMVAGPTGSEAGGRVRIQYFDSTTGPLLGQAKLPGPENRLWRCDSLSDDGQFLVLIDNGRVDRCVIATSTGDCILRLRGGIARRSIGALRHPAFATRAGTFVINVQKQLLIFDLHSLSRSSTIPK